MTPRILVAGIGNVFFGDDGFGVEVANRLARVPMPDGVRVVEYGIRGVHLAYELLDGYDALVLIDAMPMGEPPGTIAIVEPDVVALGAGEDVAPTIDAHTMHPAIVLATLANLGGEVGRVVIVGCGPASIADGIGLSAPVAEAVDRAFEAVGEVLDELCGTRVKESRT